MQKVFSNRHYSPSGDSAPTSPRVSPDLERQMIRYLSPPRNFGDHSGSLASTASQRRRPMFFRRPASQMNISHRFTAGSLLVDDPIPLGQFPREPQTLPVSRSIFGSEDGCLVPSTPRSQDPSCIPELRYPLSLAETISPLSSPMTGELSSHPLPSSSGQRIESELPPLENAVPIWHVPSASTDMPRQELPLRPRLAQTQTHANPSVVSISKARSPLTPRVDSTPPPGKTRPSSRRHNSDNAHLFAKRLEKDEERRASSPQHSQFRSRSQSPRITETNGINWRIEKSPGPSWLKLGIRSLSSRFRWSEDDDRDDVESEELGRLSLRNKHLESDDLLGDEVVCPRSVLCLTAGGKISEARYDGKGGPWGWDGAGDALY